MKIRSILRFLRSVLRVYAPVHSWWCLALPDNMAKVPFGWSALTERPFAGPFLCVIVTSEGMYPSARSPTATGSFL
jgi:hypothetical protein